MIEERKNRNEDLLAHPRPRYQEKEGKSYRETDLYQLEYCYFPEIAISDLSDKHTIWLNLGSYIQIHANLMNKGILFQNLEFEVTPISMDDLEIFLYEFPFPPRPGFAFYGVSIWGDMGIQYYTLESAGMTCWFCRTSVDCHVIIKKVGKLSKDEFLKLATENYNTKKLYDEF